MYEVVVTRRAVKDAIKIERANLKSKVAMIINVLRTNPYQNPPPYEKLSGFLNRYSRRINSQHRLVYEVEGNIIKVLQMWTHYN
jgi:Txe/YoeB family toxin of toxin-antitoxin system